MDAGFIGLGHMGLSMARNLLKAGHRLRVYNRTRSRAELLKEDGAIIAGTPADACVGGVVITMLANDQARGGGCFWKLRHPPRLEKGEGHTFR